MAEHRQRRGAGWGIVKRREDVVMVMVEGERAKAEVIRKEKAEDLAKYVSRVLKAMLLGFEFGLTVWGLISDR